MIARMSPPCRVCTGTCNCVGITYHASGPVERGDVLVSPRTHYVVVSSRKVATRNGKPKWSLRCERRFSSEGAGARSSEVAPGRVARWLTLRWFPRRRRR